MTVISRWSNRIMKTTRSLLVVLIKKKLKVLKYHIWFTYNYTTKSHFCKIKNNKNIPLLILLLYPKKVEVKTEGVLKRRSAFFKIQTEALQGTAMLVPSLQTKSQERLAHDVDMFATHSSIVHVTDTDVLLDTKWQHSCWCFWVNTAACLHFF